MPENTYEIRGRAVDRRTRKGVPELKVQVWDQDEILRAPVATGETDERGGFQIPVDLTRLRRLYRGRPFKLFFRLYRDDMLIADTREAIAWSPDAGDRPVVIPVDAGDRPAGQPHRVHGRVMRPDGAPVAGITVRAFDRDVRGEKQLGEAVTGDDGRYAIEYRADRLSRAGKKQADLIVRAYERADDELEEVATSDLILGAGTDEPVDLILGNAAYRGPSEYVRLRGQLAPFLDGADPGELTEEDIAYLAEKTGLDAVHVAYAVKAARLERETDIPGQVFYGLFRQKLPTSLPALIAQDPDEQRRALAAAVRANQVSADVADAIDKALNQLQRQIVDHALRRPDLPDRTSLGELLDIVGLPADRQRALLQGYVTHAGPVEEFWQTLRQDPAFGDDAVDRVQFTLQLSALSLNHLPLVRAIQGADGYHSLRDLIRLDEDGWLELIGQQVDGEPVGVPATIPGAADEKPRHYARTMMRMLEDAFPTAAIAHRIGADDFRESRGVARFFANNPDFDFRAGSVEGYLAEHDDALDGIDQPAAVRGRLREMQRLYNVAPRYEKYDAMRTLLADGVGSALAIRRMGETTFLNRYAQTMGQSRAMQVYANAAQATATALTLFAQHSAELHGPNLYVLADRPDEVDGIPDYESLFGSLDLCECERCRSVYSPAAYLVDILHWLENRVTDGRTALEVLFRRRPDIGQIELNCDNTNTVLPYIDLVNEVLENAVAPDGAAYQTGATADVLRVHPEHLNPDAYDTLAQAGYPWALPFGLWAEEARLYLDHLGVPRYRLMEVFRRPGSDPQPRDIAAERLGLTPLGREIIVGDAGGETRDYWGMAPNDWVDRLAQVSALLERAGLTYDELEDLLATEYINPDGNIQVVFAGPNCELDDAAISDLTEAALDRLHRFVRLQRNLGWSSRELDAALRAVPDGDLTDDFLVNLAHLLELRRRLRVGLLPMLSWWADMDTRSDEDTPSLYETLFLNKAITNPVDDAFTLNAAGDDVADTNETIDAHAPTVLGALSIGADDLALLVGRVLDGDNGLDLPNLSALYRTVTLARALKLSLEEFLTLRDLSGQDPFSEPAATVEFVQTAELLRDSGFSVAELDYLLRHQALPNAAVAPTDEEIARALEELRGDLQKAGEDNPSPSALVKQKLADVLGLEMSASDRLLDQLVPALSDANEPAIADFLADAFAGSADPMTADNFPEQFQQFRRLEKIATLLSRLGIPAGEVDWLVQQGPALGWLDLTDLPLAAANDGAARFAAWTRMAEMARLRNDLPPGEPTVFDLLRLPHNNAATAADFRAAISQRAGWSEADLMFLMGNQGYNLTWPDDYQGQPALERLLQFQTAFEITRRLGVSAAQLWSWSTPAVTFDQAQSIKQAVKSKYEEGAWLHVAEPLRDELREQQRAALVAYLVYDMRDQGVEDAEDLFGHFLIDVEMSACMLTSRIKQAISTTQLFVQRCLMNLEPDVTLSPGDAREWAWRKNYRVWEANRKVFLYPENWIEPELRDDKSPFFLDLENDLLQGDVTQESAEQAFLNYLEKLDTVARLEIAGMYHQQEDDLDVLHVFGRTRATPHVYYYRRWVDGAHWTPWERVDLDIEGDHLIPVVYNRRLHLFWPIFTERAESEVPSQSEGGKEPFRYWEIQMAWSERKNGKWLARRITEEKIEVFQLLTEYESYGQNYKRPFFFEAREENGDLVIACMRDYVANYDLNVGNFTFSGCDGTVSLYKHPAEWLVEQRLLPPNTFSHYMKVEEDPVIAAEVLRDPFSGEPAEVVVGGLRGGTPLTLRVARTDAKGAVEPGTERVEKALDRTPGTFRLAFPHQYPHFVVQDAFFFEDETRTFFVVPRHTFGLDTPWGDLEIDWLGRDRFGFEIINLIPEIYSDAILGEPDFGRPIPPGPRPQIVGGAGLRGERPAVPGLAGLGRLPMTLRQPALASRLGLAGADGLALDGSLASEAGARALSRLAYRAGTLPATRRAYGFNGARYGSHTTVGDVLADPGWSPGLAIYQGKSRFRFVSFYHPYVCELVKQLNRHGIDGLLDPSPDGEAPALRRQMITADFFDATYQPTGKVDQPYPRDEIDFSYSGAYAPYNWELFFHAPFLIADRLSDNQRFDEAQQWYHYIFDPTDSSPDPVPARFWKIKPFYENAMGQSIQELMLLLSYTGDDPEKQRQRDELKRQIEAWRQHPFQPHVIARMRRTAYQKAVVMKYLDNLIAWGDYLFRRDTIESINEATQLYVLAAQILGRRPQEVPTDSDAPRTIDDQEVKTYNDLRDHLDDFSNALVDIETALPPASVGATTIEDVPTSLVLGPTLFFCIPRNKQLLEYWDTVADRLFKIRHCMNIEGVVRVLPLFEPPIEPGMLVRAAAAGVDISSALSDLAAPLPHYRFQVVLQKAVELCNDVKSLGAALLAALEKRDAEELALLRAGHEIQVLTAVREVRHRQIEEAREAVQGLEKARQLAEQRKEYYEGRPYMNPREMLHITKLESAHTWQTIGQAIELIRAVMGLLPDFDIGVEGWSSSPTIKGRWGGQQLANALSAGSQAMSFLASMDQHAATMASIMGGYDRRADDWAFQADLAATEIEQVEKQILAAQIRQAIAERELANHDLQTENAETVEAYMHDKFTNQQLYSWMVSQVSTIYFQTYQMAYDLAKRAERAFRHEIGDPEAGFIQFGYWDSLKKGLLAGERLLYDLKRMEATYLDRNRREYEITKHISLATLHPEALVQLRETGECFVNLPEAIFDLDHPGHYMRRIKSVSLTIPCVTGPYTSVSCRLTLQSNRIRRETDLNPQYAWTGDANDDRFIYDVGGVQSIVTSRAQEDSGLFQFDFRDERYLPFEGAGAVSTWHIELPQFRQFDYDTITDVVMRVQYTAREGEPAFAKAVQDTLADALNEMVVEAGKTGLFRLFSARQEFSNDWQRFLYPAGDQDSQSLPLDLGAQRFPYPVREHSPQIQKLGVFLKLRDPAAYDNARALEMSITPPGAAPDAAAFQSVEGELGGLPQATLDYTAAPRPLGLWILQVAEADIQQLPEGLRIAEEVDGVVHHRLSPDAIEDVGVLCHYVIGG